MVIFALLMLFLWVGLNFGKWLVEGYIQR